MSYAQQACQDYAHLSYFLKRKRQRCYLNCFHFTYTGNTKQFVSGRLHIPLLGSRLILSKTCRTTPSQGSCKCRRPTQVFFFFYPPLQQANKSEPKTDSEALFSLHCINRALFTVKITSNQNLNHQSQECAPVYDYYFWANCKKVQASCCFRDSLQHFR